MGQDAGVKMIMERGDTKEGAKRTKPPKREEFDSQPKRGRGGRGRIDSKRGGRRKEEGRSRGHGRATEGTGSRGATGNQPPAPPNGREFSHQKIKHASGAIFKSEGASEQQVKSESTARMKRPRAGEEQQHAEQPLRHPP